MRMSTLQLQRTEFEFHLPFPGHFERAPANLAPRGIHPGWLGRRRRRGRAVPVAGRPGPVARGQLDAAQAAADQAERPGGQPAVARALAREQEDAGEAQELALGLQPAALAAVEQVCAPINTESVPGVLEKCYTTSYVILRLN